MSVGWFLNTAEADTYFETERLTSTAWDALVAVSGGRDQKTAVLTQAYNRLYYSKDFILPTYAEATADDLTILKKAQGEMAYYLALHLADEDRRKGLQAQGVSTAGIVKETFKDGDLTETSIPQVVRDLLCAYQAGGKPFYAVDIDRNEDEDVNTDVTED